MPYPTDLVRELFSTPTRRLGSNWPLGPSSILSPRVLDGGVEALVSPVARFQVHVAWRGPEVPGSCTCDDFEATGPCQHMWALLRWADLSLSLEQLAEVREATPFDARQVTLGQAAPPWMVRARRLAQWPAGPARDPWRALTPRDFELRYLLSVPARPHPNHELIVSVLQQKRRKDGTLGDPRPFHPEQVDVDSVPDPDDRCFLATLTRGAERTRFRAYGRAPGSYEVGAALAATLLPALAMTGRLDLIDARVGVRPVGVDPGPPWRCRPALTARPATSEVALEGQLVRGDERLLASQVWQFAGTESVITAHGLASLADGPVPGWFVELWANGPIVAPESDLIPLAHQVPVTPYGVDSDGLTPAMQERLDDAGWAPTPLPGIPRPVLRVAAALSDRVGANHRVACEVTFDYGAVAPVRPETRDLVLPLARGGSVARDLGAEQERLREYFGCGAKRTAAETRDGEHGTLPARRLPELVRELLELGWSVLAEGKRLVAAGASKASVETGLDWFEVEGGVAFGDEVVPFPRLLQAMKAGVREVALGDGSTGILPETWLAQWGLLELADGVYGDKLTFAKNQAWLLDALLAERDAVTADQGFEDARARLASFRGIAPAAEPSGFRGVLRPYQRDALGWFEFLRGMGFGGCLADDMGLGKTVQVLALLESRREAPRSGPSLVVAPRSLVFNWIAEARRFAPALRVLDYTGTERTTKRADLQRYDLLVTTYGTLRRDAADLVDVTFDYVVLDEATAIKNEASQAAKAARVLRADHRLALSGTPIENHIGELWSLFEFLNPGMLGRSTLFRELCTRGGAASSRREVARALRPFFLRRTKGEVLKELPPKSEQVIHCDLSPAERARYDELRDHYRASLLGGNSAGAGSGDTFMVLEALLRLRQAACHPGLIDPALSGEESAKLEALVPRLVELTAEGHKALVFSQFTSLLALVRTRLDAAGVAYEYLDGQTRDRKAPVERFQTTEVPVFLISLKAGGHGLNLTASDYVFLLDPWWNPAVEAQAVDRAHRLGQTRPVIAYRLIARDTVEERVQELQAKKRELAAALFEEDAGAIAKVTREDLRALLA